MTTSDKPCIDLPLVVEYENYDIHPRTVFNVEYQLKRDKLTKKHEKA